MRRESERKTFFRDEEVRGKRLSRMRGIFINREKIHGEILKRGRYSQVRNVPKGVWDTKGQRWGDSEKEKILGRMYSWRAAGIHEG